MRLIIKNRRIITAKVRKKKLYKKEIKLYDDQSKEYTC